MLRRTRLWRRSQLCLIPWLLGLSLAAPPNPAAADEEPTDGELPKLVAETPGTSTPTPAPAVDEAPANARVPKTRFSVRKQIDSVEPTSWLSRFGRVLIRPLER